MLQAADNIARAGQPVLYVSLEMARSELVAKIVSRMTYEKSKALTGYFTYARTTIGVLNTHKYKSYEDEAREILARSFDELEEHAGNLYILEGVGNIGTAEIQEYAEKIRALRGVQPVIMIDYLQILSPGEGFRGTDKQAADIAIRDLKRLSRDENTPVFTISSFNRESYREPVSLTSFKESGGIEFGSDVVLALQYAGMDRQGHESVDARRSRVDRLLEEARQNGSSGKAQALELKILKNRNGERSTVLLEFVPMFNYYRESDKGYSEIPTV
jgi:replicative DNA helicase